MSGMKRCPRCQRPEPIEAGYCAGCGHQFRTRFTQEPEPTQYFPTDGPLRDQGHLPAQYQPPPAPYHQQPPPQVIYVQPPHTPEHRPFEQTASAALGCGILSWFVGPPLFGVIAMLMGFWALGRIEHYQRSGKGCAVAGIVFGLIGLVWWCAAMFILNQIAAAPG